MAKLARRLLCALLAVPLAIVAPLVPIMLRAHRTGVGLEPVYYTAFNIARMRLFGSREAQVYGCKVFQYYANTFPTSKEWMRQIGAIDAGLELLRKHPYDKEVQWFCSEAVGTMCLYSLNNMEYAGDRGAVELVVDMFTRWPEDGNMQKGGTSGCFMDFSYKNRERFQRHGGIEAMLNAIKNHYNNSAAVVQSWFGFSSGTQQPNAGYFVAAGGVEWAVKCMRDHAKSPRVREEVLQAMRSVLQHVPGTRPHLLQAGYMKLLVASIADAPSDYHTISPACANMNYFVWSNRTARLLAIEDGAINVALQSVLDFHKMKPTVGWAPEFDQQYTVYDDCLRVLMALSAHCHGHKILVDLGAAQALQNLPGRSGTTGQKSGWDGAKQGWGSYKENVRLYIEHLQNHLQKDCVAGPHEEAEWLEHMHWAWGDSIRHILGR